MTERGIYLKQLELGPMQNFIYLIGDPATREAAVVDPGWEVPTILETLRRDGYRLTRALVTHHHFDHVMGLEELLAAADVPVHVHRQDAPLLKIEPGSLKPMRGGESLAVGGLSVQLIHTPGHTPGSQCFLVDGRLFSGDTLFIRSCGRCDLPGGDPRQMFESFSKTLRALDERTGLYPGHNYADVPTSTLAAERRDNPFFAADTQDEFLRLTGFA
jgi:glyoxylase-like metal-dependent hydrolase (beta-lactamase superfamily II)